MSTLFGIARERLKRSATRIDGVRDGDRMAACVSAISERTPSISVFSFAASERFGAITASQPTRSTAITAAKSRPSFAGVGSFFIRSHRRGHPL